MRSEDCVVRLVTFSVENELVRDARSDGQEFFLKVKIRIFINVLHRLTESVLALNIYFFLNLYL